MNEQYVVIIGTGGTIAGQGSSDTDLTGYEAGVLPLSTVLDAVPALNQYGPYQLETVCNIDSSDMNPTIWADLHDAVQRWVDRDDVAGVVILHGTDTMEETAYYLHLTLDTDKPVVLTGAMRPAGALSADGPLNILEAVQTVRTGALPSVCVVMNSIVHHSRYVTKTHTTAVDTFQSKPMGPVGIVQEGQYQPLGTPVLATPSALRTKNTPSWAEVAVIYTYAGMDGDYIQQILKMNPKGLIIAGMGNGTLPTSVSRVLRSVTIPVVRSSRTGNGMVSPQNSDALYHWCSSDTLSPQKARILLALALGQGKTNIQELLNTH